MGTVNREISTISAIWAVMVGLALALVLVLLVVPKIERAFAQSTPTIEISNGSIVIGDTIDLDIVLSEAPDGLSGFNIDITTSDASIARVTQGNINPAFGIVNVVIESNLLSLQGVDLGREFELGAIDILLGTVEVLGISRGEVSIDISTSSLDDDLGFSISTSSSSGILDSHPFYPTIPTQLTPVQDNNDEGFAADSSGNCRID